VIKIWGGSGKRTIDNREKRCKRKASSNSELQKAALRREALAFTEEKATPKYSNNILDFETLSKMCNEYRAAQYDQLAAVVNETTQTVYVKKQQNLKFLTL